jgi:hypothetical protein
VKALKVLVILMGVAIVAGFAVVALTIAGRMGGGETRSDEPWVANAPLPDGCSLAQVELGEDRVLLRLEGPESLGCQQMLLIDDRSGRLLGRIEIGAPSEVSVPQN